jgi:hypothetical protein
MTAGEHASTTVTEIDLIEVDETVDHTERKRRRARSYVVEVRTPAGFEARFRVHPGELVETLATHAEQFFVNKGELAPGNYRLELLRDGTTVPLTPSATLHDAGVTAGAVCALVVADPQVDG